jgi:hypothetical protein
MSDLSALRFCVVKTFAETQRTGSTHIYIMSNLCFDMCASVLARTYAEAYTGSMSLTFQ